ncbi:hypothetical protein ACUNV4_04195 [Granulosicoccus sp. 3-233]|uniref:hypothetical protein n=1 Tax=Granulosicoccus sp. 3-233 TaxID=3417969 RepID=UPI003D33DEC9
MSYLESDLSAVRRDCDDFRSRCQSVQLAVSRETEELDLGSSPFIQLDEDFHVYLNQGMAGGGSQLGDGQVNLMFLEDEIHCPQTFSRRQLSIRGNATTVPRGYQYTRIMVAFQDRLGSFMDIVRLRPDSRLVRIKPLAGRYINELSQVFTFKGYRLDSLQEEATATAASSLREPVLGRESPRGQALAGDA